MDTLVRSPHPEESSGARPTRLPQTCVEWNNRASGRTRAPSVTFPRTCSMACRETRSETRSKCTDSVHGHDGTSWLPLGQHLHHVPRTHIPTSSAKRTDMVRGCLLDLFWVSAGRWCERSICGYMSPTTMPRITVCLAKRGGPNSIGTYSRHPGHLDLGSQSRRSGKKISMS